MVFSSIPAYLDPANWQQQPNYQAGSSGLLAPPQQPPPIPPPLPAPQPHGAGGAGSIRPGSMADRARMANIPLPEAALKCPRCESTNTKFCYFNNYSLTQPRHFCKTCRRYWTRGGALRNVPVGGGCRRNKRSSKGNSSNSKSSPANSETASGSTSSTLPSNSTGTAGANSILGNLTSQLPQLRFMSPLGHLTDFGPGELGLNYGGMSAPVVATSEMNFEIGSGLFGGGGDGGVASVLSSGGLEQWRMQQGHHQFPNFLGGFDPTISSAQGGGGVLLYNTYNNQGGGGVEASGSGGGGGYVGAAKLSSSCSMFSQLGSVKMEAANNSNANATNSSNNQDHHESRQFSGSVQGNEHQWTAGTTAWTDLSGFSSSSTSNPL